MYTTHTFVFDDSFILDEEFDGGDSVGVDAGHTSDDLGWEDQLDNGEEVSL